MTARRRQSGMSILGIFAILLMLGFFALCAIRIAPPYFEYLSVKNTISNIATESDTAEISIRQIRRKIDANFNTNQIYELEAKDVNVFHKGGKTYIDANYEVRLPILWRIDAVVNFDDLFYVLGEPDPIPPIEAPKT
jgi:hypothetical protein